ncbi:MAG: sigma-70 family RNA polymerase sigma factor, partial [Planctomycetia bacterium]|nr:sigma-70 family RNA polymerase sigma factor [Planctomycetia bacterium]
MSDSLQPSRKLPPTERDFDVYEAVHIAGYPTREQSQKYDISQTRVRQIVRRVIEWLGEVIPPQAKIAKEQQSHLARQIAADRFNLQYAEASTSWYQSGDLKFAGLRIRLTHAHARLGLPGSLIGGLAADAIEGLEVPAYVPPPDTQARSASEGPGSQDLLDSKGPAVREVSNPVGRGSPDPAPAPTEGLPNET